MKITIHELRHKKYQCSVLDFDLVMYDNQDGFFEPLEDHTYSECKAYALFKVLTQVDYEVDFPEEYNFQQITIRYPFNFIKELFESNYAYALVLSSHLNPNKFSAHAVPWHKLVLDKEKLNKVIQKIDNNIKHEKQKIIEFIKYNIPINSKLIDKFMIYVYRLSAWYQLSVYMIRNEPISDNYLLKKAYEYTIKDHQS